MRTDNDYFELVSQLDERLSALDPDEQRIRRIARDETDKRILATLGFGAFVWATIEYGWVGGVTVFGLAIAAAVFSAWRDGFDPNQERHLVTLKAKDLVRLEIIAEVAAAGQNPWALKEKESERGKREVIVADNDRWVEFWERTYTTALSLEKLSPKEREKRFVNAAAKAKEALVQARGIADREDAELIYWADNALSLVEQANVK